MLYSIDILPARNSWLTQQETNHYITRCASELAWPYLARRSPGQLVIDLFAQPQRFAVCCQCPPKFHPIYSAQLSTLNMFLFYWKSIKIELVEFGEYFVNKTVFILKCIGSTVFFFLFCSEKNRSSFKFLSYREVKCFQV